MFHYDITQGLKINTPLIKKADNMCTNGASIQKTDTSNNNYELSIEHNENSTPLTPEQIEAKQSAKQRALDDIAKAKRANKTIIQTDEYNHTIETKYDALGNEEKKVVKREDGSICEIEQFNDGVISKTQRFWPEGDICEEIEYNEEGKPIIERSYDPNETSKIKSTIMYEYYDNGNLKFKYCNDNISENKEIYYENGTPKYKMNNGIYEEYNDKGLLIKSGIKNKMTGEDDMTTIYEYDSLGRVIKESISRAKRELGEDENETVEISYDGNVTKRVAKNTEGQVTYIKTIEKLANGAQKYCIYSPDGTLRTEAIESHTETGVPNIKTTKYNKNGQIIGSYIDDGIESKYYNSNGEKISEDEYFKLESENSDGFEY